MSDLILGTANFDKRYGIANGGFRLGLHEIEHIIRSSQDLGIINFDTAPNYGKAESNLGLFLNQSLQPNISSKLTFDDSKNIKSIIKSVRRTLRRTKTNKLDNLYLHHPEILFESWAGNTISGLKEVLDLGLANRIGASVYSIETLMRAKEKFPELTVFQVPENICDRRMLNCKNLLDYQKGGIKFIIRSVFLQGLLIMPVHEVPLGFESARKPILELIDLSKSIGVRPLDLCIAYGRTIPWASGLIIGVANSSQLTDIANSECKLPLDWESRVSILSETVLDPRRWSELSIK